MSELLASYHIKVTLLTSTSILARNGSKNGVVRQSSQPQIGKRRAHALNYMFFDQLFGLIQTNRFFADYTRRIERVRLLKAAHSLTCHLLEMRIQIDPAQTRPCPSYWLRITSK